VEKVFISLLLSPATKSLGFWPQAPIPHYTRSIYINFFQSNIYVQNVNFSFL
jgi:hypothetical protein